MASPVSARALDSGSLEDPVVAALERLSQHLEGHGAGGGVPEDVVQGLFQLPARAALACLSGLTAPHVHSPIGLLRWKLRNAQKQPVEKNVPQASSPSVSVQSTPPPTKRALLSPTGEDCERSARSSSSGGSEVVQTPTTMFAPQPNSSWANAEQHCPGCGFRGSPGRCDRHTRFGQLQCAWGRHRCGASWSLTVLDTPAGRAANVLNCWLPSVVAQAPVAGERSASAPVLPHCLKCGGPMFLEEEAATQDVNKEVAVLRCEKCALGFVGTTHAESGWKHFCLAAVPEGV
jgi:hypothetical protein